MKEFLITIQGTATVVVPADIETRTVYLHNDSGGSVYLGGSAVTTTAGYHFKNGEQLSFVIPGGSALYGICAEGTTKDISVLRPAD